MALRFSSSSSADSAVTAIDLPARARQSLLAEELGAYRELFERLGEIEDPHRRYWATAGLVEQGLAAGASVAPARLPEMFAAALGGVLDALEREPSEPRLLNYAGILLYELWSLDAAKAMFDAVRRLDPAIAEVDRNLVALKQRRASLRSVKRRAPLHPSLPALERQALDVAQRARPASGLRLSLCMIVRDEQEMLPRSLAAVADAVDELIVVDTGSRDATIEIARSFGARVIEHPWTGSFAEARNVSFDAATGDWLLYLDADEVLVSQDTELLRSLTGRTWREAFYLSETNYTGEIEDGTAVTHNALRMFRNRPEYRFEGRLHEQIANRLPGYLPERFEATSVRIEHYGYLGVVRNSREKSRRNIELLRVQMAESPPTPFLHYNLGSEYAAAGEALGALAEFERAWALIEGSADCDRYEFAPALMSRLVKALRVCGRPQEAFDRAEEGLRRFPGFTDLVLEQAFVAVALGQDDRAIELYELCMQMGDAPRRYTATVGCGTYLPRVYLADFKRSRGELAQAIELLERCLVEHPEFTGSVLPYASALLADGTDPEEVVRTIERHVSGEPSAGARFLLGTALYEAGATVAGEQQFKAVLERQPQSSRARVALGEALLAQRRYPEAAEVAGAVPVEDGLAVIACRTELFALIAGEEQGGVLAALERARSAGMDSAELELFGAWHELRGKGETDVSPSPESVPMLTVIMEALLRVQDFENFEALHGLWQRMPVPVRERRQALAEMYLRRGFLASAAEEWMAVCQEEQPDVEALLGLARVAAARGMDSEAAEFVSAALAREPGNQAAAEMLSEAQGAHA
jgi:tetratricopeptide (TPR) repeat protein